SVCATTPIVACGLGLQPNPFVPGTGTVNVGFASVVLESVIVGIAAGVWLITRHVNVGAPPAPLGFAVSVTVEPYAAKPFTSPGNGAVPLTVTSSGDAVGVTVTPRNVATAGAES